MIENFKVKTLFELSEELLEGPIFDNKLNLLYFVSILDFKVYRYNPISEELIFIRLDSPTSCVYITSKYGVVAASVNGFYRLDFDNQKFNFLFKINIKSNLRFNDGILDSKGRFLIGTMGYPNILESKASLLSYEYGKQPETLISGVTISNGITFTKDSKKMYYIDTPTKKVKEFNYCLDSGKCEYLRDVIEFTNIGFPDGMDIDSSGNLWIAEWGGYAVSVWNPVDGSQLKRIKLPTENITSLCFDCNENLYVTSANSNKLDSSKKSFLFHIERKVNE
jgi:sugar lactone lactonase YvrE